MTAFTVYLAMGAGLYLVGYTVAPAEAREDVRRTFATAWKDHPVLSAACHALALLVWPIIFASGIIARVGRRR